MQKTMRTALTIGVLILLFSPLTVQVSYPSSPGPPQFRPVYLSFEALRSGVASFPPRDLADPGKILVQGNLLFINERLEGVHVIDNTDPAAPKKIAFIKIPGNIDIAVRGGILYADSYVDLVALDVSDPTQVVVTERLEGIYPNTPFVEEETFWSAPIDPSKGVVVGREPVPFDDGRGDSTGPGCIFSGE